jgi:hypothetical protein
MLQVPPVPASMASDVGRFNDIRGHSLVDWRISPSSSPLALELLVCHRPGTNTSQLFRLQREGGELLPVTECSDDAVASGSYDPIHGNFVIFQRSKGGSEEVRCIILKLFFRLYYQARSCHFRDSPCHLAVLIRFFAGATLSNESIKWRHRADHPRHSQALPPHLASRLTHCADRISAARSHR